MNSPQRTACLAKGGKNVLTIKGHFFLHRFCVILCKICTNSTPGALFRYPFFWVQTNRWTVPNILSLWFVSSKNVGTFLVVGLWPAVPPINICWWMIEKRKPDTGNRTQDTRTDIYQILFSHGWDQPLRDNQMMYDNNESMQY